KLLEAQSKKVSGYISGGQEEMPKITEARQKRVQELVQFAKDQTLKEILKGRNYNDISQEEKNLYDRVQTVKFGDLNDIDTRHPSCSSPNAMYSPHQHKIVLCP